MIQVILINLKPFKYRTVIVIALTMITIIVSVMFYQDLSETMTAYKQILLDTNGVPEIGMAVYEYKKDVLMYSIISSILAVVNAILFLKHSKK